MQRAQDYVALIKKFSALELTTVGNYKILSEIGSGAFGKVYLGYHSMLRCKVCLKRGSRSISSDSNINDNLMREFYYLREFRYHPYITKLYEIIFTESSVYMILEYYPSGDLFEYVTKNNHLSVDESLRIFTQLLGAVCYLHKNGCCHRDLKLENVLLDKKLNVKLSDFGFTRELPFVQHGAKSLLSEYCGTGAYMAPEIVKRTPYSGIKIDIWALGVILYTMLTGEMPFDDSLCAKELEYAIVHNKPRFLENIEDLDTNSTDALQQIKVLLNRMLTKDPEDRVNSIEDVLRLPLFQPYGGERQIEIVNKLIFDSSNIKNSWSDLTVSEKGVFKNLVAAGIDREILKRSIQEETLDSVYGIWSLLNNQVKKKEKKSKRKSVLSLTRSRSLLGTAARQAFSASPTQSDSGRGNVFLSRTGSLKRSEYNNSMNIESGKVIKRTGSSKKLKALGSGDSSTILNSIRENADATNKKISSDQMSVVSKSTQKSTAKSTQSSDHKGKKHHFSLFRMFKSKNNQNKDDLLNSTRSFSSHTGDSSINSNLTRSTNQKPLLRSNTRISNTASTSIPITISYSNISDEENTLMTPDQTKLKRTKPTRPLSAFSVQTSASETSQGSGYITGYSTDMNIMSTANTNHADSLLTASNLNDNTNANTQNNANNFTFSLNGGNNFINNSPNNNQFLSSPQASTSRPKFSRGISDWSTNMSSQQESPNSSFVALSRTNSIDSISRSISSRKKCKSSVGDSYNSIRRGRSPLSSKMNTKWAFNNISTKKHKPLFTKGQRESQIIEEETSDQADDDIDADEDDDDDYNVDDFVNKTGDNFSKLKLNKHDTPIRSGRLYMRKKSMKFPILPVTEENDQDLEEFEDEADVEEDNHDYDDVTTELSDQGTETNHAMDRNQHSYSIDGKGNLSGGNDKLSNPSLSVSNLSRKRTNDHLQASPIESSHPVKVYSPIPFRKG